MKKYIFLVLVCTVITSCGPAPERNSTKKIAEWGETEVQVVLGENPFMWINESYFQNEDFLQCSLQSVDQCILWSISPDKELTIDNCSDLLLKSNQETCKQWIITSQARENWDISQCDQLSDPSGCRYEILVAKWISDKTVDACDTVSQELKIQCNNTVVQSLSYETLDTQWCDKILVEIEGDDLDIIKQNCIRDIEQAKEIEAEITQQQAEEEERIQAEQESQQATEVKQQDQENDITEESVDPASNEVNESSNEVVKEELSTNE